MTVDGGATKAPFSVVELGGGALIGSAALRGLDTHHRKATSS
ncbi:hypothetical protein [Streptomyces sp. AM 2-1-1]|nr:hypothetical protein [Streptomyces sp. AM 2-1-1]WEH41050.1 hypothetical protein PZB77_16950 [Streptomyces sp. AM 2-1-1]